MRAIEAGNPPRPRSVNPDVSIDTETVCLVAMEPDRSRRYYNSLLAITADGVVRDAFDKFHLVPYGEYLPLDEFLSGLGFRQLVTVPRDALFRNQPIITSHSPWKSCPPPTPIRTPAPISR